MKILIVSGDDSFRQSLVLGLKSCGVRDAWEAEDGEDALEMGALYDFDAAVIDDVLPDMANMTLLRRIREKGCKFPVVMSSSITSVDAKVDAFAAGADDYMVRPFHYAELGARLGAIVRRSQGHADSLVQVGPICVNLTTRKVEVNGVQIHFTAKEREVTCLLALRLGTTVTKAQILDHLYAGRDEPEMKIVDVFICKVRKKLRDATGGDYIGTEWGVGYRMVAEPVVREAKPGPGRPEVQPDIILTHLKSAAAPQSPSEISRALSTTTGALAHALRRMTQDGRLKRYGRGHGVAYAPA